MPTTIEPLRPEHQAAVAAFNARLAAGGETFAFPETTRGLLTPETPDSTLRQTAYVLVDGADVHGGYILKSELFYSDGREIDVGNFQLPLSEGTVDRRYGLVGLQLVKDVLARQPRLYCLGMGSLDRPLPRLLARLGWTVEPVPFLFRVIHARNFLRHIEHLRQRPRLRLPLDMARWSGIGSLAVWSRNVIASLRAPSFPSDLTVSTADELGADADTTFAACKDQFGLISDRRAAAIQQKLPARDRRLIRLVLRRGAHPLGWVIISRSQLSGHKQFGDMRLGAVVDGIGSTNILPVLVRVAVDLLIRDGVDLIVTNQTHSGWIHAFHQNGFFAGPSNFILARSPALMAAAGSGAIHFTRGDGDGPINL